MSGQTIAYIRVSTTDQNPGRQREMIGETDKVFTEQLSAKSRAPRPGLDACIGYLRGGDSLKVASIDRLARSLVDLRNIIDKITTKGASVTFIKEHLTFAKDHTDPRATLMLGILGSFAEFEGEIIRERQAEGIALAKQQGKFKGRKRALTPAQITEIREQAGDGTPKTVLAARYGVSRSTIYRAVKRS